VALINKSYLDNVEEVKKVLERDGIVILKDFFEKKYYEKLKEEVLNLNFSEDKKPLMHSYLKGGFELPMKVRDYFENLIDDKLKKVSAFRLVWKDYTLMHDSAKRDRKFEIVIDLTDDWNQDAGGQVCYDSKDVVIPVTGNSVTIVKGDVVRYVKYVNNLSKGKERLLIICSS
tara:strand:+ start:53593 stop:54111 length:519 start_codon:yes stop_codon:yes gene_type:complete